MPDNKEAAIDLLEARIERASQEALSGGLSLPEQARELRRIADKLEAN